MVHTASNNTNDSNSDNSQLMHLEEPPSAMLSLLEKYSRMDAQMTQVRHEITRIQLEIQTRNVNTEKLVEERQEMIVKQERIAKESTILRKDAKQTRQQLKEMQQEVLQSKHRKELAQRNMNQVELQSKEYRQRFFESSVAFRKECKKRKITCQKLGLIHEPLVAHAVVFQPQLLSSLMSHESSQSLQSQEKVREHNRLAAQLKSLESTYAACKRKHDTLQQQKENLLNRSRDRNRRKANLQAQLDRILKDIDTLQTKKSRRRNQQQKASARRESLSAPNNHNNHSADCPSGSTTALAVGGNRAATIRNPYAKRSKPTKPPSQSWTSRRESISNSQQCNNGSGSNVHSSGGTINTEQYQNRVAMGRRRRAPQDFGLSLRIQDENDMDSSSDEDDSSSSKDELLSFVAFRNK